MFGKLYRKVRLFALRRREPYFLLYNILGFIPDNIEPYQEALCHGSANLKTKAGRQLNNERLEYLGDTILGAAVSDIIYRRYPYRREGFLTNVRSRIVQRKSLNSLAKEMKIYSLLNISGVKTTHNHIGGNALEALVGAIYIDKGYDACLKFVRDKMIQPYIDLDTIAQSEENFKSRLMEWGQKYHVYIDYVHTGTYIDENNYPVFKFEVKLSGIPCGEGSGFSKKEAQQIASQYAYKRVTCDQEFANLVFEAAKNNSEEEEFNVAPVDENDI